MNTILESIFELNQVKELKEALKMNRPFVAHNLSFIHDVLSKKTHLQSLPSLINQWPAKVDVHLPDASDEISTLEVNSTDAYKMYRNKMGLLFNHIERYDDEYNELLFAFMMALGFSKQSFARALVYATPEGGGTATHFDQNINLIFQLKGKKRWWIAQNETFINPLTRHTLHQELDPELASYQESPLPEKMPENAQEILLEEGSFLFLPRGCWHKTSGEEEALALNFTYTVPTWIDLFGAAIRGRLSGDPKWRESAIGFDDMDSSIEAQEKFDELLNEFKNEFTHWNAAQILGVTEGN